MRQHREDDTILSTLNELLNEYKKGVAHNVKEMKEKRKPPLTTAEVLLFTILEKNSIYFSSGENLTTWAG